MRSEVFRRALEAQGDDIQTFGVAGFFGVPIEYAQLAADDARPQLPGLLAPKYRVTDTGVPAGLESDAPRAPRSRQCVEGVQVELAVELRVRRCDGPVLRAQSRTGTRFSDEAHRADHHDHAGLTDAEDKTRMPRITSHVDGTPVSADERCQIAESFLRTIGLTTDFARVVLLVGHGSETKNNAHAAGLDCGACCGQPGDVNARAAAALFNDADGPRRPRRARHRRSRRRRCSSARSTTRRPTT